MNLELRRCRTNDELQTAKRTAARWNVSYFRNVRGRERLQGGESPSDGATANRKLYKFNFAILRILYVIHFSAWVAKNVDLRYNFDVITISRIHSITELCFPGRYPFATRAATYATILS